MNKKNTAPFALGGKKPSGSFVYLPPHTKKPQVIDQTAGFKFGMRTVILDDWWLIGGTRWSRSLFRLKHPIVYSKRGLRNVYRRIKRLIFGDPPMVLCRKRVSKKEALKHWPSKHD